MNTRRRSLVFGGVFATQVLGALPAWAERIVTPAQMRGPFYPLTLPLDDDNDLVTVKGRPRQAAGVVTDVAGRIVTAAGASVPGARVEIWQVDAHGRYHHPDDDGDARPDENFQGHGQTTTDSQGAYRFRTVRPVAYPGRAPHIHFAVTLPGRPAFYTQMYLAGAPENDTDFLLNGIADRRARRSLVVALAPSPTGESELAGRFDIVLGVTPASREP